MRPAKRLKAGDRLRFGQARRPRLPARRSGGAGRCERAEGGEVTLDFDLAGVDLDLAIEAAWRDAPAALHRQPARRGRARPARLPDHLRPGRRLGRRADRRPALHPRADGAPRRGRRQPPLRHPARRRRAPSCRSGRAASKTTACTPSGASSRPTVAEALNAARARRRPDRLRRHHLLAPAGERRRGRRAKSGRSRARRRSSSAPATASAPPTA